MVWCMERPVIGICTALEQAQWGVWEQPAALLSLSYIEAVQRAGPCGDAPATRSSSRSRAGTRPDRWPLASRGADIDPSAYGRPPHAETVETVPTAMPLRSPHTRGD